MNNWFEVWVDGQDPPWVLVVQSSDEGIRVFDPQEGRKPVFAAADYESVRLWLLEDEFTMVRGRAFPDADG
jgi:hypothetical protein